MITITIMTTTTTTTTITIMTTTTIMTTIMTTTTIAIDEALPDQESSGPLTIALRPVAGPAADLPFPWADPIGRGKRRFIHADVERAMRLKVECLVMAVRAIKEGANRNYQRNHRHLGIRRVQAYLAKRDPRGKGFGVLT